MFLRFFRVVSGFFSSDVPKNAILNYCAFFAPFRGHFVAF